MLATVLLLKSVLIDVDVTVLNNCWCYFTYSCLHGAYICHYVVNDYSFIFFVLDMYLPHVLTVL